MNESRRRVTLGLLSAPLVATLAGCDSSNDTQAVAADFHTTMLDKLTAELNDEKTARQLAPFIEEACFNMTPSRVAIDQAHCVIAFAFGNRPGRLLRGPLSAKAGAHVRAVGDRPLPRLGPLSGHSGPGRHIHRALLG